MYIIWGDFNARTAMELDYVSDDTDTDKYLPIPDCYTGDIALDRKNMDKSKSNSHGNEHSAIP